MTGSKPEPDASRRGYGNIYTPHAGAMIIHVQRESGLANRTVILSARQVRFLRVGGIAAAVLLAIGTVSWVYLASQAVRMRSLTHRLATLQHDVQQLDTLKRALAELDARFQQVQKMMRASGAGPAPTAGIAIAAATTAAAIDSTGIPNAWPLPVVGTLIDPPASELHHVGIEVAVPRGTLVRAAGGGMVVEIRDDSLYGRLVRVRHRQGYESVYGNLIEVRVARGDRIAAGAVIAATGDSAAAVPAHLHFEIVHDGVQVNPASIMTRGPLHGDLQ